MKKQIIIGIGIVFLLMSSFLSAQSNIGFMGIGAQLGYVSIESDIGGAIDFGANAALGTIIPKLNLGAKIRYWKKGTEESHTESYYGMTYTSTAKTSNSEINIAATATYSLGKPGSKTNPYVGGGLGLAMSKWKVESSSSSSPLVKASSVNVANGSLSMSDSETNLALHLLAGIIYPASPSIDAFAEVGYTTGGFDHFGIYVGGIYKLK